MEAHRRPRSPVQLPVPRVAGRPADDRRAVRGAEAVDEEAHELVRALGQRLRSPVPVGAGGEGARRMGRIGRTIARQLHPLADAPDCNMVCAARQCSNEDQARGIAKAPSARRRRRLDPGHVRRIRRVLADLDVARNPRDVDHARLPATSAGGRSTRAMEHVSPPSPEAPPRPASGGLECVAAHDRAGPDWTCRGSVDPSDGAVRNSSRAKGLRSRRGPSVASRHGGPLDEHARLLDRPAHQPPGVPGPRAAEPGAGRRELPHRRHRRFLRRGAVGVHRGEVPRPAGRDGRPRSCLIWTLRPRHSVCPAPARSNSWPSTTSTHGLCAPGWSCSSSFRTTTSTTSRSGDPCGVVRTRNICPMSPQREPKTAASGCVLPIRTSNASGFPILRPRRSGGRASSGGSARPGSCCGCTPSTPCVSTSTNVKSTPTRNESAGWNC